MFETERIYPDPDRFSGPNAGKEAEKDWIDTSDFRVLRNLQEFPRAWVVHNARMTLPITGLSRETRSEAFQEILYAGDTIWNDTTQRVYDPHSLPGSAMTIWSLFALTCRARGPGHPRRSRSPTPIPQQAVLEVNLESPGLVVLADIYYPGLGATDRRQARAHLSGQRFDAWGRGAQRASSSGLHVCATVIPGRAARVDRRPGRLLGSRPGLLDGRSIRARTGSVGGSASMAGIECPTRFTGEPAPAAGFGCFAIGIAAGSGDAASPGCGGWSACPSPASASPSGLDPGLSAGRRRAGLARLIALGQIGNGLAYFLEVIGRRSAERPGRGPG